MALIHGQNGKYPCPISLVPNNKQIDLTGNYPLQTDNDSENLLLQVEKMNHVDGKKLLKAKGLQQVKVCYTLIITFL